MGNLGIRQINAGRMPQPLPAVQLPDELPAPVMLPPVVTQPSQWDLQPRQDMERFTRYVPLTEQHPELLDQVLASPDDGGFRSTVMNVLASSPNRGVAGVAGSYLNREQRRRADAARTLQTLAEIDAQQQQALRYNASAYGDIGDTYRAERMAPYQMRNEFEKGNTEQAQGRAYDAGANLDLSKMDTEDALRDPRVNTERAQAGAYEANAAQSYASAGASQAIEEQRRKETERDTYVFDVTKPFVAPTAEAKMQEAQGKAKIATRRADDPALLTRGGTSYPNTEEGFQLRERLKTIDAKVTPLNNVIEKVSSYAQDEDTVATLKELTAQRDALLAEREGLLSASPEAENIQKQQVDPQRVDQLRKMYVETHGVEPDQDTMNMIMERARGNR